MTSNQSLRYKKFLVGAASAALVASAVAPADAATTSSSFKDVNKNYTDAVNYLVENGIAKGTSYLLLKVLN